MARRPTLGTPGRMQSYLDPDREEQRRHPGRTSTLRLRRVAAWAAAALGVVVMVLTARNLLSNSGDLSSAHSRFEQSCASCHGTGTGADALNSRCTDCHDRLQKDPVHTTLAHMRYYDSNSPKVQEWKDWETCVDCHTEHMGRDADIVLAAERRCTTCHSQLEPAVRSFDSTHPEFAVLRAQARAWPDAAKALAQDGAEPPSLDSLAAAEFKPFTQSVPPEPGIRFTHKKHLEKYIPESTKAQPPPPAADLCNRCHTMDDKGLDLVVSTFEGSCAGSGCHTTRPGTDVLKVEFSDPMPIDLQTFGPVSDPAPVPLLPRLRFLDAAGIAPEWLESVRADFQETDEIVEAQGSFVKMLRHRDPWVLFAVEMLSREADEIAAGRGPLRRARLDQHLLEARGAVVGDPCDSANASLVPETAYKQELCGRIASLDAEITEVDAKASGAAPPAVPPTPAPAGLTGQQALTDLAAVASGPGVGEPHKGRLGQLTQRLQEASSGKLTQDARTDPRREDRARDELRRQLDVLSRVPAEWVQREVRTLQYKLDRIDEAPGPEVKVSVAAGAPDQGAELSRRRQLLDAERVRLRRLVSDLAMVDRSCETLFLRLALTATTEPTTLPADPEKWLAEQIGLRESAIRLIAKPCLQCHVLGRDPSSGRIQFAPVRQQERGLGQSTFLHRPHLRFRGDDFQGKAVPQGNACTSCHSGILTSNLSAPVHFDGIDSCRSCHNGGSVSSECRSCHTFHPPMGRESQPSSRQVQASANCSLGQLTIARAAGESP